MRVHLKGIHRVKARLADGSRVLYYYAWRGGPRLEGQPGSPEFLASYNAAYATRRAVPQGTLFTLIAEYRASSEFKGLRDRTRKDYGRYLTMIENKFGSLPIAALEDKRIRGDFKEWRDGLSSSPRTADLAWTVLARVLSVAKDRGRISVNPCERGGRLYRSERADKIWTEDHVAKALASFPAPLRHALLLALWTGQRQGDLLALTWHQIGTDAIRLRQSKTGRNVVIPIKATLRKALADIPKKSPTVLTTLDGKPWKTGFRASWRKACAKAGISGVTFHDLRGSTVTRMAEEGGAVPEIITITGHSPAEAEIILARHYLSRTSKLGEQAVNRLERRQRRTDRAQKL